MQTVKRAPIYAHDDNGKWLPFITGENTARYFEALLRGKRYGYMFILKRMCFDQKINFPDWDKVRAFENWIADSDDAQNLFMQIWREKGLPDFGTVEHEIWQIERKIDELEHERSLLLRERCPYHLTTEKFQRKTAKRRSELDKLIIALHRAVCEKRGWIKPSRGVRQPALRIVK